MFTEPPFTPEVTLAPSPTPAGATGAVGSDRLQFHTLVGQTIVLHVTGFQPGENVRFTVTKPDGSSFTGPPRPAKQDGSVEAQYAPPIAGTYTVVAKGDRGGEATNRFIVSSSFTPAQPTTRPTTTRRTFTPAPTAARTPVPTPSRTPAPAATP